MLYDPYESETSPPNSVSSGAVDILTAPPKAPVPLVEMPAPRWICIVPTDEMRSGVSYQYIECESGLFIETPLMVTLSRVASVPRRRIDVPPMPMPVSLVAIIEGVSASTDGMSNP